MNRAAYTCEKCDKWANDGLCREHKREAKSVELGALSEFFHEPVLPLSVVCDAVRSWARCVAQGVRDGGGEKSLHGGDYAQHLDHVLIDITKSGLMSRMIYHNQEPRTEKCERHNGHMDTGQWVGCYVRECCDGSGWLETDLAKRQRRIDATRRHLAKRPEDAPSEAHEKWLESLRGSARGREPQ